MTSQHEANEAIRDALAASDVDSEVSDSEQSDSEDVSSHQTTTTEIGSLPSDDHRPFSGENDSNTSVARDVATGNVSFGRFASQWLSRQSWPVTRPTADPADLVINLSNSQEFPGTQGKDVAAPSKSLESEAAVRMPGRDPHGPGTATLGLLPRILKTARMIFTSRSYFFSYDFDLTRRFEKLGRLDQPLTFRNLDPLVSHITIRSEDC